MRKDKKSNKKTWFKEDWNLKLLLLRKQMRRKKKAKFNLIHQKSRQLRSLEPSQFRDCRQLNSFVIVKGLKKLMLLCRITTGTCNLRCIRMRSVQIKDLHVLKVHLGENLDRRFLLLKYRWRCVQEGSRMSCLEEKEKRD